MRLRTYQSIPILQTLYEHCYTQKRAGKSCYSRLEYVRTVRYISILIVTLCVYCLLQQCTRQCFFQRQYNVIALYHGRRQYTLQLLFSFYSLFCKTSEDIKELLMFYFRSAINFFISIYIERSLRFYFIDRDRQMDRYKDRQIDRIDNAHMSFLYDLVHRQINCSG